MGEQESQTGAGTTLEEWGQNFLLSFAKGWEWLKTHQGELFLAVLFLVMTCVGVWLVRKALRTLSERWHGNKRWQLAGRLCGSVSTPLCWILLLAGIRLSLHGLIEKHSLARTVLHKGFLCVAIVGVTWAIASLFNAFSQWVIQQENSHHRSRQVLLTDLLRRSILAVVWFLAFFLLLQTLFRWNISALLAGAGVIGMALAFAAQSTIANLFGAVSLIADAPFQVGEWVKIGDQEGIVESIGLRSTRLRAFSGELLVIPNRLAADALISNQSNRKFIRQVLDISLTYSTTPEQMRKAKEILREILEGHPLCLSSVRPPMILFSEMKDWSLNLRAIIWFDTQNFLAKNQEMDAIHFEILERFSAAGLDFAFPSNTTYLVMPPKPQGIQP